MSTFLFLNGSNDETTIVVYRWQSCDGNHVMEITGKLSNIGKNHCIDRETIYRDDMLDD